MFWIIRTNLQRLLLCFHNRTFLQCHHRIHKHRSLQEKELEPLFKSPGPKVKLRTYKSKNLLNSQRKVVFLFIRMASSFKFKSDSKKKIKMKQKASLWLKNLSPSYLASAPKKKFKRNYLHMLMCKALKTLRVKANPLSIAPVSNIAAVFPLHSLQTNNKLL